MRGGGGGGGCPCWDTNRLTVTSYIFLQDWRRGIKRDNYVDFSSYSELPAFRHRQEVILSVLN